MIKTMTAAAAVLAFVAASPAPPAAAQDNVFGGAIMGGLLGAGVGAAVGGRRGAAVGAGVGAVTGAMMGAEADRRGHGGYYFWDRGRCWYHYPDGEVVRVARDYCG